MFGIALGKLGAMDAATRRYWPEKHPESVKRLLSFTCDEERYLKFSVCPAAMEQLLRNWQWLDRS